MTRMRTRRPTLMFMLACDTRVCAARGRKFGRGKRGWAESADAAARA